VTARIIEFPLEERRRRIRLEKLRERQPLDEHVDAQLVMGGQPGFAFRLRPSDDVIQAQWHELVENATGRLEIQVTGGTIGCSVIPAPPELDGTPA
jgi:hypothetical protein